MKMLKGFLKKESIEKFICFIVMYKILDICFILCIEIHHGIICFFQKRKRPLPLLPASEAARSANYCV